MKRVCLVLLALATLAGCGGSDDEGNGGAAGETPSKSNESGEVTLTEGALRQCFEDAGLKLGPPGDPDFDIDFSVSFGGEQKGDVWVERTAADAKNVANGLEKLSEGFNIENVDKYFFFTNNAGIGFEKVPTGEERQVAEDCFAG